MREAVEPSIGDRFTAALKAWRDELGHTPTPTEALDPASPAPYRTGRKLYGGWDQACDAAGVSRPDSRRRRSLFCEDEPESEA